MTDLVDDVKASFERSKDEYDHPDGGSIQMLDADTVLAPGFNEMRGFYNHRLHALARRGYRHFAGSTMPRNSDELLERTSVVMLSPMVATLLQVFSDGVMIGQQTNQFVRMCFHFDQVDELFNDDDFRQSSTTMASGFAKDPEVMDYFAEYITGATESLAHATGFAHRDIDPSKVWDIWILIGTATISASYLAGHQLGSVWQERDVLDGIEIATKEAPDGAQGEDEAGR